MKNSIDWLQLCVETVDYWLNPYSWSWQKGLESNTALISTLACGHADANYVLVILCTQRLHESEYPHLETSKQPHGTTTQCIFEI